MCLCVLAPCCCVHCCDLWDTKRGHTRQQAPRRPVHWLVRARTLTSPPIGAGQPMTSAHPSLAFQRRPRTRPARPLPADTVPPPQPHRSVPAAGLQPPDNDRGRTSPELCGQRPAVVACSGRDGTGAPACFLLTALPSVPIVRRDWKPIDGRFGWEADPSALPHPGGHRMEMDGATRWGER